MDIRYLQIGIMSYLFKARNGICNLTLRMIWIVTNYSGTFFSNIY